MIVSKFDEMGWYKSWLLDHKNDTWACTCDVAMQMIGFRKCEAQGKPQLSKFT